jgi:hypothetical protein
MAIFTPFREKRTISKAFSDFESRALAIRWGRPTKHPNIEVVTGASGRAP